jgi:outer membrane protein OmpA-like peptidoglycan-associated protein
MLQVSAADPEDGALEYSWSIDGGIESSQPSFQFDSQGRSPGTHTVRVVVTDVDGMSADCNFDINIEQAPNRDPVVTLNLDKMEVYAADTVTARAEASDPDDDPLTYSWTVDGQSQMETSPEIQITTEGLAGGSHTVAVTVQDERDGTATEFQSFSIRERIVIQTNRIDPDNLAKAKLDEIALKMQQDPRLRAIITGHTDDRGSEDANQVVGQRRADGVRDYLVNEHGIDVSRTESLSAGESQPIGENESPEGQQQNRRVVVELFVP